jgi:hypothetical protein
MTSDPYDVAGRFGISIVPRHRYVPAGRTAMVTETGSRHTLYPCLSIWRGGPLKKEAEDQTGG